MDGDNSCDDLTVSLNCSHASTSSNTILTPSVIGAIAAGVVVAALCILIIIACILKLCCLGRHSRRKSKENDILLTPTRFGDPEQQPKLVEYSEATVKMLEDASIDIALFPEENRLATEGEEVVFRVRVTGVPVPELTWFHNGEEVMADYSKELAEDGSLTIPSAEIKHSGVYRLVAVNRAGRVEREVKLLVQVEEHQFVHALTEKTCFSPVPVEAFGDYVSKCHDNGNEIFYQQIFEVDKDSDLPTTIGFSSDFKKLNRFGNITVYDDNRIILRPLEDLVDCQRDFINASYVDGYNMGNKFIAAQGPMSKTTVDFWRMVWQERPHTIVMVTNLEEDNVRKCHQYWPDTGTKSFGPFKVTITGQEMLADYITRHLAVQLTGSSEPGLKVTQFHFTAWPDHGVPDYATSLLAFHKKVKRHHKPAKGPMLVHCSAGVGRTGTVISIDCVLDQIEKEGVVDIAGTIIHLRTQRMKMVQSPEQYIFIHDAILEAVMCGNTQIDAALLRKTIQKLSCRDPVTCLTGFENQFKVLEKVSSKPREIVFERAHANSKCSHASASLSGAHQYVGPEADVPDFVYVNGYKQQRAFIISQSPLQSTIRGFLKMMYDRQCGVVVMLCGLVENGQVVCSQYWPSAGMIQFGEFTVDLLEENKKEGYTSRILSIFHNEFNRAHKIVQLHITNWSPDGHCSNLSSITDVIAEMMKIQRRTGNQPIAVHCSDTVSRSGMFCAIATTIERCKTEGVVDVFQVVKALRIQKPEAVHTMAQFQTLFDAVLVYLDSFETYSNFRDL